MSTVTDAACEQHLPVFKQDSDMIAAALRQIADRREFVGLRVKEFGSFQIVAIKAARDQNLAVRQQESPCGSNAAASYLRRP